MMIRTIMEAVSPTLWQIYPKQYPKLLSFIVHQYYPRNKKSPEMERLVSFAEKFLQNNVPLE